MLYTEINMVWIYSQCSCLYIVFYMWSYWKVITRECFPPFSSDFVCWFIVQNSFKLEEYKNCNQLEHKLALLHYITLNTMHFRVLNELKIAYHEMFYRTCWFGCKYREKPRELAVEDTLRISPSRSALLYLLLLQASTFSSSCFLIHWAKESTLPWLMLPFLLLKTFWPVVSQRQFPRPQSHR